MKKIMPALMVGTLALTLLVPSASFAATATDNNNQVCSQGGVYKSFHQLNIKHRGMNGEQLMEVVKKYAPELEADFQSILDNMKEKMPQIDEATKEKLNEIRQQVKDGTLTEEQAKEEMEALGIKMPAMAIKGQRPEIDEATKEKLNEIRQQVKDGTLTEEQAKEEMEALGIKARAIRGGTDDLHSQLRQAIANNDESQIKTLLTQLLARMQSITQE